VVACETWFFFTTSFDEAAAATTGDSGRESTSAHDTTFDLNIYLTDVVQIM
jgi:hypothetical protein